MDNELTYTEKEADKNASEVIKEFKEVNKDVKADKPELEVEKIESVTFLGPKCGTIWNPIPGKGNIVFVKGRYTTSDQIFIDWMNKEGFKREVVK